MRYEAPTPMQKKDTIETVKIAPDSSNPLKRYHLHNLDSKKPDFLKKEKKMVLIKLQLPIRNSNKHTDFQHTKTVTIY